MRNVPNDVTIISGDNEEIQSNTYILSLFSSTLRRFLSTSSTLLFPECSTFSVKYVLNMINIGFVVTQKLSNEDINEIIETAQLLSIEMGELRHDNSYGNSNKGSPDCNPKTLAIEIKETEIVKTESITDVMDNLIRIFHLYMYQKIIRIF